MHQRAYWKACTTIFHTSSHVLKNTKKHKNSRLPTDCQESLPLTSYLLPLTPYPLPLTYNLFLYKFFCIDKLPDNGGHGLPYFIHREKKCYRAGRARRIHRPDQENISGLTLKMLAELFKHLNHGRTQDHQEEGRQDQHCHGKRQFGGDLGPLLLRGLHTFGP